MAIHPITYTFGQVVVSRPPQRRKSPANRCHIYAHQMNGYESLQYLDLGGNFHVSNQSESNKVLNFKRRSARLTAELIGQH
ncbi:hypothetical protein [Aliiroseovarius sp. PrR006]|uniref:hypothetical protein n=1 Tax=Aliiroseovarius sp. PrR006 TaxID=2706883 RepID=UPI0013D6AC7D|nr:hypothetical protein [Aliiroseovarius sp. PrR006]NDW54209.1 hypothetical protein [Aliiroseovarius sp. PrR006]